MCHEEISKKMAKNPHHLIDVKKRWKAESCESCHGPGSVHAESASPDDIRNPAKISSNQADRTCLACHLNQKTQVGRISSGHARSEVSCSSCHSIHGGHGLGPELKKPAFVNQLCSSCHTTTMAEFQRPFTHKLPQNAMSCVDCHNPHGSLLPRSIQTVSANEPGCLRCHSDKRGPFVFEHAPVRMEGCGACHQPHGSANPKMLNRPREYQLCLECHSQLPASQFDKAALGSVPPAFHDLKNPRYRSCSSCHVKVHGSYANRMLLR